MQWRSAVTWAVLTKRYYTAPLQLLALNFSAAIVIAASIYFGSTPRPNFDSVINEVTNLLPILLTITTATVIVSWILSTAARIATRRTQGINANDASNQATNYPDQLARAGNATKKQFGLGRDKFAARKIEVLFNIEQRVKRLRLRNQMIIIIIGMAMIAGALVVIFAGRLTSLDAAAINNIDKLKAEVSESKRRLQNLRALQSPQVADALSEHRSDTRESGALGLEDLRSDQLRLGELSFKEDVEIRRFLPSREVTRSARLEALSPADKEYMAELIKEESIELNRISGHLAEAWAIELKSERGYNDWRYITATAITRVGVVLIIVYLVQILLGLHRYNTRLATHYNSRHDLLMLWDGKQSTLRHLDEILSSQIDFGKEPRHPLESVFKAIGQKIDSSQPWGRPKKVASEANK